MYLKDYLEKYKDKKIKMFVDMDGVIVDYDFGNPQNYYSKRALVSNIEKLEYISKVFNIELYILSVSKTNIGVLEKNKWLDKYAYFFKKENRIIISREANDNKPSYQLKTSFLKDFDRDDSIFIVIDDDPKILKEINKMCPDIVLLKDPALVD